MKFVELGKTDENGTLQVYLPTGNHDLMASIGKQNYSGMAMITGSPTEIELSRNAQNSRISLKHRITRL